MTIDIDTAKECAAYLEKIGNLRKGPMIYNDDDSHAWQGTRVCEYVDRFVARYKVGPYSQLGARFLEVMATRRSPQTSAASLTVGSQP